MLQKFYLLPNFFEKLLACQFWQSKLGNRAWQQKALSSRQTQGLQSSDALQPVVLGVKLDPINVTLTPGANVPL